MLLGFLDMPQQREITMTNFRVEPGEAQVLLTDNDSDHRYRLTQTSRGILVSCAAKGETGLLLGPSEWLYQTREAAEKGLKLVMSMNAWWTTIARGYDSGDLPKRCKDAVAAHAEAVERLGDAPLIGQEIRTLRLEVEVNSRAD